MMELVHLNGIEKNPLIGIAKSLPPMGESFVEIPLVNKESIADSANGRQCFLCLKCPLIQRVSRSLVLQL